MRLGDVFSLNGDDQYFQVAGIDPFGQVIARKFELDFGPVGEFLEFTANQKLRVLFNSFEPVDIERDWEVCELNYQVEFSESGDWSGELWFEAAILLGDGSQKIVEVSPRAAFTSGNQWPNPEIVKNRIVHHQLVETLLNKGWKPIIERRGWWWKLRFKRPPLK